MIKLIREMVREILLQDSKTGDLLINGFPITVEIASTHEEQQRGLMNRVHLDPEHGMLFCYEHPQDLSFWMKNTTIPLSIAFIDEEGRIVNIEDMNPHDESRVMSGRPCRWALEVNKGWFSSRNIPTGSHVLGLDV